MKKLEHRIPPPLVGLLCAVLAWVVAEGAPGMAMQSPLLNMLALALALAGAGLDVWGVWAFRRSQTTVNPLAPGRASAVVLAGPYRFTRNPMYLGMALLLLAWCVFWGNPLSLVALALFVGFITRFQIVPEERALAAKFGEPYQQYLRSVRRWL